MTERVPGRKPGPQHRDELARIWEALDAENQKILIAFARGLAREAGVYGPDVPLVVMTGEIVPGDR
ncbi:hypothetical protein [Roseomonas elaeocarpi]|uniref:Uncharacterized protein n=1 Tax=Roseomonas elaeocarpi TaxID=907779 RepID=A0ABV6JZ95_9PROT